LVWLIFPTAYCFLMISPNLHAIWVYFFLNLSQELKFVLLLYLGTLGDCYSLKGSKKYPSRHRYIFWVKNRRILIIGTQKLWIRADPNPEHWLQSIAGPCRTNP